MKFFITQLIVIVTFCELITCSGYFTIVGSKLLRKNAKYKVAITSRNYEDYDIPTLEVAIQNINGTWKRAENITLINGKIQSLEFDLTGQPIDDYTLEVKSINGEHFSGVVEMNMNTKSLSTFVQTDKAIYKPNDTVQFRVLVLNENLKPLDEGSLVQIHITDGAKNLVTQFDDVILVKGVFQGALKLSDWHVLGFWHIHVVVDNKQEANKTFEVAEYTLPYLKVSLGVNPHAYYDEQKIRATLVAEYMFGEKAEGNATVTATVNGGMVVSKTFDVKKEKKLVEFNITDELKVRNRNEEINVKLFAVFKEKVALREESTTNTTANVQLHLTPHKMQIITNAKTLKPGLPFTIRAIVLFHDKDVPVTDNQNPVTFIQKFYFFQNEKCRGMSSGEFSEECEGCINILPNEKSEAFLSNGISEIDIQIPDKLVQLELLVKYLETEQSLKLFATQSQNNEYIKIKSRTEKSKLTENIQINVQSTKEMNEISYHVLSTKGDVVASGTIEIFSSKSIDFDFTPTYDMVPKARIVVFYITSNGEIISDSLEFEVDNELRNFIDIKIPKRRVSPSELIDISITSNPNSFVGLLGVDQSVLALKGGNDIDWSAIIGDLKQYNEVNRNFQAHNDSNTEKTYLDFESSEVFIITNARDQYEWSNCDEETPPWYNERIGGSVISETSDVDDKSARRKKFPETWLFDSLNFEFNQTNAIISKQTPDTIISWIITGFSIDPITGLGLTKQPTKLNVFQPFFVKLELPYSIKRGEIVDIPISVFNYMENNETAKVTLYNEDSEFAFIAVDEGDEKAIQNLRTKNIDVKSQSTNSTVFTIRPLKIGLIKIKVVATSLLARDGVERYLNVEPEGVTESMHKTILIDLIHDEELEKEININIPSNVVPGSIRIVTSVTGDLLGTSVENLVKSRKLLSVPKSAELNMINFVRNIVVLDYLRVVNKLTPEVEEKAKTFLETGYQSIRMYKRTDGSYSIYDSIPGGTWLTAFVAKYFFQAAKYISIETKLIKEALQFLSRAQNLSDDGSFFENGYIPMDIQGGSYNDIIALTAYTLITLLENSDCVEANNITIDKALTFLNKTVNSVNDNYSLAVMAYALQLADDPLKNVILSKLESGAISEGGMIYWRKKSYASNDNTYEANSLDIETTAYALQAFLKADRLTESVKIMKWLVSQRNENGGFTATVSTVVGLQALASFATKMYEPNNNIDITVKHHNNVSLTRQVNERNLLILQKYELPSTVKNLEISAKGHGFSTFQLYYQYNIDCSSKKKDRFIIKPIVYPKSSEHYLDLGVCTSFIPDEKIAKCNMAVMNVTFPSGFAFERCTGLEVKTEPSKTYVTVHIADLNITGVCLQCFARRVARVSLQMPASVYVYDHNDHSRKTIDSYNLPNGQMFALPVGKCDK